MTDTGCFSTLEAMYNKVSTGQFTPDLGYIKYKITEVRLHRPLPESAYIIFPRETKKSLVVCSGKSYEVRTARKQRNLAYEEPKFDDFLLDYPSVVIKSTRYFLTYKNGKPWYLRDTNYNRQKYPPPLFTI